MTGLGRSKKYLFKASDKICSSMASKSNIETSGEKNIYLFNVFIFIITGKKAEYFVF